MAEETKTLPELSADGKKVLEIVEKMSVLELADLVKVMEDKFGVSAAAPVAVA
ncbi:MAG TPA: 50S ribosomal protein L7/L12, partial [Candidatus Dojkabacteria bacterium]|nr:50S ribosomal protein L7/L12 [Candidatus Dojkabacteria bacterium]